MILVWETVPANSNDATPTSKMGIGIKAITNKMILRFAKNGRVAFLAFVLASG